MLKLLQALLAVIGSITYTIPEQYQGNANIMVIWTNLSTVPIYCGPPSSPKYKMLGCVTHNDPKNLRSPFVMVLPNPCDSIAFPETLDPNSFAHLACHEKAHVNGWVHKTPT